MIINQSSNATAKLRKRRDMEFLHGEVSAIGYDDGEN